MPSRTVMLGRLERAAGGRVALLCVLAIAVLAAPPAAQADGFAGSKTIRDKRDSSPTGRAQAFAQRARASGRISRLNVYLGRRSTASAVRLGLYSGARSRPGRRLASCTLRRPRAGTWNSCRVAPVRVAKRTRYWMAILQPRKTRGKVWFRGARRGGAASYASRSGSNSSRVDRGGLQHARSSPETRVPASLARGSGSPPSILSGDATSLWAFRKPSRL